MAKKCLVIGSVGNEAHENDVRNYFLATAPDWTCHICELGSGTPAGNIITYQTSIANSVQYAIDNSYEIIVRSYSGGGSYELEWEHAMSHGILVSHAHGSNTPHQLLSFPSDLSFSMYIGAGLTANELSYGPTLDFYDAPADNNLAESWATALDLSFIPAICELNCSYNSLSGITGLDVCYSLYSLIASNNHFSNVDVDYILVTLDVNSNSGGYLGLTGNNPPTAEGLASKESLENKGWVVEVDV